MADGISKGVKRSQSSWMRNNAGSEIVKKMPVQMEDVLETQKGDPLEKTPEDNE